MKYLTLSGAACAVTTYPLDFSLDESRLGNFTLISPRIKQYAASEGSHSDYYLGYYNSYDTECSPDSNGQYTPFDSAILKELKLLDISGITVQATLNNAITPYEYLRGTIHIDVKTNTAKVYAADGTVLTSGTYYVEGFAVFNTNTEG